VGCGAAASPRWCNPPRLIFSEQLITLVVDVGECLAAMVAQQLRALDAFRLRLSWPHRHRDRHQLAVGFIVRRLVAEIDLETPGCRLTSSMCDMAKRRV
jgi:hypothetical protein